MLRGEFDLVVISACHVAKTTLGQQPPAWLEQFPSPIVVIQCVLKVLVVIEAFYIFLFFLCRFGFLFPRFLFQRNALNFVVVFFYTRLKLVLSTSLTDQVLIFGNSKVLDRPMGMGVVRRHQLKMRRWSTRTRAMVSFIVVPLKTGRSIDMIRWTLTTKVCLVYSPVSYHFTIAARRRPEPRCATDVYSRTTIDARKDHEVRTSVVLGQDVSSRGMVLTMFSFMAHPEILLPMTKIDDPLERFVCVVKFYLSGWHIKPPYVQIIH